LEVFVILSLENGVNPKFRSNDCDYVNINQFVLLKTYFYLFSNKTIKNEEEEEEEVLEYV
jgi:hypothetical protein